MVRVVRMRFFFGLISFWFAMVSIMGALVICVADR